jgi:hypothetical protein
MRGNPLRYTTRFTRYRTHDDLAVAIARNQPALNGATEAWLTAQREHGSGSPQEMTLWPELDRLEPKVYALIDATQIGSAAS